MVEPETDLLDIKELVDNAPAILAKYGIRKGGRKKATNGKIRGHLVKGRTYYYYCRGSEPEIYLGSAETILNAVKPIK